MLYTFVYKRERKTWRTTTLEAKCFMFDFYHFDFVLICEYAFALFSLCVCRLYLYTFLVYFPCIARCFFLLSIYMAFTSCIHSTHFQLYTNKMKQKIQKKNFIEIDNKVECQQFGRPPEKFQIVRDFRK